MVKFLRNMVVVLSLILISIGCKSSVTDNETQQMPKLMKKQDLSADMKIFEYRSHAMQRDGKFPIHLVVEPSYYRDNEIKRGDIVYIELPEEIVIKNHEKTGKLEAVANRNLQIELERRHALRVVGVPKETIRIKQGQVFIDGRKLDTFYGKEYYWERVQDKSKAETMKQDVKLAENQYFLLADQWWRSAYSSNRIGAIPKEYIKGKVIGYVEQ